MGLGRTHAVSLLGLQGAMVEIEADIGSGLPGFVLIGLPDAALSQAKDRVRSAAVNSGCPIPVQKITVNFSPASLPKQGSGFDLGIAVALLAAADEISAESIEGVVHLGELGLDGRLRPIAGVLPSVLALARAGHDKVMVPTGNVDEASLVPGVRVIGVTSLRDAAIWHGGQFEPEPAEPITLPRTRRARPGVDRPRRCHRERRCDLGDARGGRGRARRLPARSTGCRKDDAGVTAPGAPARSHPRGRD